MCNHYRNHPEAIEDWRTYIGWSLPSEPDQFSDIKVDVYPKRSAQVVRTGEDGSPIPDVMQWGVPTFLNGKRPGTKIRKDVTNVRNLDSNFWRSMLNTPAQRCIVPFTEFAEPTQEPVPELGRKGEWWFKMADGKPGGFAGIWRWSEEAGGKVFAFLTCEPNDLVKPYHPKAMPVVLHREDYETWLTADRVSACALAVPYPTQLMVEPRLGGAGEAGELTLAAD